MARGSYDWFNAVSAGRPLLGITVSCVPRSAALRVDRDLDDGNLNTGRVRYWNFVGGWLYLSVTLAAL